LNGDGKNALLIAGSAALAVPWVALRLAGFHGDPIVVAALSGVAILGAAFLLSWASEVAQLDISQGLALAVLALVAVLPEYAVDMYFTWKAAEDPQYAPFAIANMTGANRLLIGVGWSSVIFIYWWRSRRTEVPLENGRSPELPILGMATVYALIIPIKGDISLLDTLVLGGLFVIYLVIVARTGVGKPHLVGPAMLVGALPKGRRRLATLGLFLYSAVVILASAEPFSEGLVETGSALRIEEFILVQWLAPLASEAPEFIVASLFALRGYPALGIRTMVSSKVNQWTLLVGMIPLVYSLSLRGIGALPLDERQAQEMLLTAAQSAFAVVLIARYAMSLKDAVALFTLFAAQLVLPFPEVRYLFSGLYLVLGVVLLVRSRERRNGLRNAPLGLVRALTSPKEKTAQRR